MENIVREGTISKLHGSKDQETWTIYFTDNDRVIVTGMVALKVIAKAFDIDTDDENFPSQLIGKHIHFTATNFNIMDKFATVAEMELAWTRVLAVPMGKLGEQETD